MIKDIDGNDQNIMRKRPSAVLLSHWTVSPETEDWEDNMCKISEVSRPSVREQDENSWSSGQE